MVALKIVHLFASGVFAQIVMLMWMFAFKISFLKSAAVGLVAGTLMFWMLRA